MDGKATPPKLFIVKYLYLKDKHKYRKAERTKSKNYSKATDQRTTRLDSAEEWRVFRTMSPRTKRS